MFLLLLELGFPTQVDFTWRICESCKLLAIPRNSAQFRTITRNLKTVARNSAQLCTIPHSCAQFRAIARATEFRLETLVGTHNTVKKEDFYFISNLNMQNNLLYYITSNPHNIVSMSSTVNPRYMNT